MIPFVIILYYKWTYESLPIVLIGFWCGSTKRRPKNGIGANEIIFWILFWYFRNFDSGGLCGWLNKSFSPNDITGTRDALEQQYSKDYTWSKE